MTRLVSSGFVFDKAESPIEQDVVSELTSRWDVRFVDSDFASFQRAIELGSEGWELYSPIIVAGQVRVGPYRVDLLLGRKGARNLVLECDGHEFHKEHQWQRDRDAKRDRFLRSKALDVEHLTGSQIFNHLTWEITHILARHGFTDGPPPHVFKCQECVRLGRCSKDFDHTGRGCNEERKVVPRVEPVRRVLRPRDQERRVVEGPHARTIMQVEKNFGIRR